MNKIALIVFLILPVFFITSCKNEPEQKKVIRDTTINERTSFNNLFLDSTELQEFITKHPEFASYQLQYFDFYKHRNFEYAWFDSSGLGEQASNFMNLLSSTILQLNDSSLYNKKLVQLYDSFLTDSVKHSKTSPLQTELFFTGQFFMYASKVYKGSDLDATELGWFIPRKKIDFTALLDSVIVSKGKGPDRYLPLNEQYKLLLDYLVQYNKLQKKDNWDSIPVPEKVYKLHDSSAAIGLIKKRLILLGDLSKQDDTSHVFDTALVRAVKSYQHRMGLEADGVIGAKAMEEINTPITQRIKQILINLERVRWMPAETDSNYIMVNIPEYRLHVFDSGKKQFDMKVIVGSAANNTVIFTGNLKYIVFSPYWNVPESIVKKEIIPGIQKNPAYLEQHNMEITGYNGKLPVIRQKPGAANSLGLVKFLFPNNYDIYLHDTPNRNLFSQSNRTLSHGCIRISDPAKMASYLLRSDTAWTAQKIDSAMHLQKEKWVSLNHPVRVFIGYFTTWVDEKGKLNFRKDVYGHDNAMADKLFAKAE